MGTPVEPTRLAARLVRGGIAMVKHENNGAILSSVRRGSGTGFALGWLGRLGVCAHGNGRYYNVCRRCARLPELRGWSLAVCEGSQAGDLG